MIVSHSDYPLHLTGVGHPESPQRYLVINQALHDLGLLNDKTLLTARPATREELELCHTSAYIDLVEREVSRTRGITSLSTGDAMICPTSWHVGLLAAGGVLTAVDAVFTDRTAKVFCNIRPPGHHATRDHGMGFCLFNNVALGARYAQQRYGAKRVAIIDWDVHHGNGTQNIFEADPTVFYFSVHEWPQYPGTGSSDEIGVGNILNCPILADDRSNLAVLAAFEQQLLPAMEKFKPDLVMISAGFDGHALDPLGGWNLTDDDYVSLTRMVTQIAQSFSGGRVISVLEGGYSLQALATAVPRHILSL